MALRVGLTGGIATGKSEVGRLLAAHGAVLIDADVLAREVISAGTEGFAELRAAFGAEVIGADGELDRAALGRVVFADPGARVRLEAIVHPRVRARAAELERAAVRVDPNIVAVHDIPLLVETGQVESFDLVVVVDVPVEVQRDRLVRIRGMTPAEADRRISAQVDRAARRAAADVVIDNAGSRDELARQVAELWTRLSTWPAATNRPE